ncbi:hypothetical protein [Natronomonas marina]|jgi:Mn-dependent DtxR family transcriptional regulator|uniref:hypothetical protein n=1 Tax=Natronomonas marina TaxID=2961939 RepID=UPI0020C94936|nr:hypothetical protein [Natronomonas marina]
MTVRRRDVLACLAAMSDAETGRTTTVAALSAALDANEATVAEHVTRLAAGDLAVRAPDAGVRVTVTGEELLELGAESVVVVPPSPDDAGGDGGE